MRVLAHAKKRIIALATATVLVATSLLPKLVNAYNLEDGWYADPAAACTWGDDSEAMQNNNAMYAGRFKQTGLALNSAVYAFNPNLLTPEQAASLGNNYWPLGAQTFLTMRPGYENEEYAMFDGRHSYCSGNHESAVSMQPGVQMFRDGVYRLPDQMFPYTTDGKTNPTFNFLMLALACYYPGEYSVPDDAAYSYQDPYASTGIVSQMVTWLSTDGDKPGFTGVPEGADPEACFQADLNYFKSSRYYQILPVSVNEQFVPEIYNDLFSAPGANTAAAQAGMTTKLDAYFYDIWWAAYYTSLLTPDWDKEIMKANATLQESDGEYHAYLDLFVNDSANVYLNGISFLPYGDWEYLGLDEATGLQHFKSATGELDENGSIGQLYWPNGVLGAFMPMDLTKAKLYTFDTYNKLANPASFGRTQTQFASWVEGDLNLYVTIGDDDDPDNPGTGTSTGKGSYTIKVDRFEHQENFTATYNVNLLKYDSETGKPLADSRWDVLEAFDDSQLDDTDLDRTPDMPGEYSSGIGTLNSTSWGDDEISSNYSGNTGVTDSDTNKYNWGNDSGTQFERWDDPKYDPCKRDENVTGEDGLLYEIDSSGNSSGNLAHTDIKNYTYNKGYCTGHPAPEIEYIECNCVDDCDCDELNQELHDEAWAAWYAEVQKCEQLVKEGGFFHCIDPGDAAKEALQTDRDEFFKDFISLTYDYSAEETEAPKGYILHGTHTDDIPIEWRTVTSSEYKDTDQATALNHTGGTSDSEDVDDTNYIKNADEPVWESAGYADDDTVDISSIDAADDGDEEEMAESVPRDEEVDSDIRQDPSETKTESEADVDGSDDKISQQASGTKDKEPASDGSDSTELDEQIPEEKNSAPKDSDSTNISLGDEQGKTVDDAVSDSKPESLKTSDQTEDTDTKLEMLSVTAKAAPKIKTSTSSEADESEETEAEKETSPVLNDEENGIFIDYDLLEDDELSVDMATESNAVPAERVSTGYSKQDSKISLMSDGDENDEEESDGYLRDSETFKTSQANQIVPPDDTIVDWTFVVYDHRTEGEIHFNKRDFDLYGEENEYGAYGEENGDGTLEGAVYGLFAAQDIIHPDTDSEGSGEYDTGIVYKKDNLVAVATTDRNGDGSFMVITEAPGYTYDYEKGRIVKTDDGWADEAPKNLYTNQADADAKEEDAERFIGHTPANEEIEITDSNAGDGTYYEKLSSNQGIDDTWCDEDTTGYMPIQNNENNNGNCWIGRPLILGKDGTSYYIKELSRSEGYELSVYGKDGSLITNREAFEAGGEEFSTGTAVASDIISDRTNGGNTFSITSDGTQNGYIVKVTNIPEGATFNITSSEYVWDDSVTHPEQREKEEPVYAVEGELVMVGGHTWPAEIGDTIEYAGKTFEVNNVYTVTHDKQRVQPNNSMKIENPYLDITQIEISDDVVTDINRLFLQSGFRTVEDGAPWISLKIPALDTENIANAVNTTLFTDDYFSVFNAMQMLGTYEQNGQLYAAIGYCYRDARSNTAIYNEATGTLYVKTDITYASGSDNDMEGFVYRTYSAEDCEDVIINENGFITSAVVPNEIAEGNPKYAACNMDDIVSFKIRENETFWAYADGERLLTSEGEPAVKIITETVDVSPTLVLQVTNNEIPYESYEATRDGAGTYTFNITQDMLDQIVNGTLQFRITYNESVVSIDGTDYNPQQYATDNGIVGITFPYGTADSYIESVMLMYPGQDIIISDGGTTVTPTDLYERPIRQKIKVSKDIQTLAEPKVVWYCLNCGNENQDGEGACGFCGTERTTEETKTIRYAHDTYSAVHKENISADRDAGVFDTVTDWLTSLLGGTEANDSAADIPNFRFKAYLKSNLERLYRDEDGNVVWMDRNGNTMTPQYEDTNGDGNYDTFTWKYDEAYGGKTVDFPEKDIVSDDGTLESANVQKIYTKVRHVEDSDTTSARANNVWSDYEDPQLGATENAGEKNGYSTSLRETADGESGDLSGMAVRVNDALYSYDGKNTNTDETDRINDGQNSGYTRILETRRVTMEDNDTTREVEMYNYEKFFDAIAAANADIWDDDMHSTFTGDSMANYPGQHWFETFYEQYQKDDADPDHTLENTDGADADNTAGGDKDTSFKPFRWIRENLFGDRDDYEKYPAEHNGQNTEVVSSTSDFAKANAEASDAVRRFATKWYLEDEAAKLMTANGLGEDIAKDNDGEIEYDEAVYDEALFNAIAKAYNYLKPFYVYDLDTIYSVEWDGEENGGADNDYTTLSIDNDGGEEYYNISGYLPYGTYVIVEQQPQRIDGTINDWENRSYTIEKPKEVILPAVYDAAQSNDTTDNYDEHYNYSYAMDLQDQAASDNYLIRFGEEWPHNNSQDEREYVIRAHSYFGDFEVYKYGLDIDKLQDTITYDGGDYAYAGFGITQEEFDPLKDYYETTHRGEEGVPEIGKENGGSDESHLYAIDETNKDATANGTTYDGDALEDRFFYGSISEDAGIADDVMYKGGTVDDNNASGMQWKDGVRAMTGELTAYEGKYASMLVPWTVTAPADLNNYSSADFSGYADVNMRDGFFTTTLRVNKVDSETGEYILHDNAIFALYAGSRYQSFEEIEEDAKLIADPEERAMFPEQFKPGDAKFYLQDTVITGSREFLMAMGAKDITKAARGRSGVVESGTGAGELYSGTVPKGTPICLESERIMLTDEVGARTGQMTVYTTLADVLAEAEDGSGEREYINQNIGWFETPQPIGAGVYVLAELKAPAGYARSKPVAYEVYSDGTYYYPDGDMYGKVKAVRYEKNFFEDFEYQE